MKGFFSFLILFTALVLLVIPVGAQEIQIPAVSDADPVVNMAENLFALIYNATYLPFAAGMVTLLTALSKRLVILHTVQSNVLALFWTVVVWALWTAANQIGYGVLFESMTSTLTTIGTAVLGITGTAIASGRVYQVAKNQGVALVGYQRPTAAGSQPAS